MNEALKFNRMLRLPQPYERTSTPIDTIHTHNNALVCFYIMSIAASFYLGQFMWQRYYKRFLSKNALNSLSSFHSLYWLFSLGVVELKSRDKTILILLVKTLTKEVTLLFGDFFVKIYNLTIIPVYCILFKNVFELTWSMIFQLLKMDFNENMELLDNTLPVYGKCR